MTLKALAKAASVYFDSNAIIYFVERDDDLRRKIGGAFQIIEDNKIPMATSEVAVAECLHGAHKLKSAALAADYRALFDDIKAFNLVPVTRDILESAARLAPENGMKLVDAIHFASAIAAGCDVLLTNDRKFRSGHGVKVIQVSDL